MVDIPNSENPSELPSHVLADTIEEVMREVYGADAATATMKHDLSGDDYTFQASYEGELENTDKNIVMQSKHGAQSIFIRKRVSHAMIELIYGMEPDGEYPELDMDDGDVLLLDVEETTLDGGIEPRTDE